MRIQNVNCVKVQIRERVYARDYHLAIQNNMPFSFLFNKTKGISYIHSNYANVSRQ